MNITEALGFAIAAVAAELERELEAIEAETRPDTRIAAGSGGGQLPPGRPPVEGSRRRRYG